MSPIQPERRKRTLAVTKTSKILSNGNGDDDERKMWETVEWDRNLFGPPSPIVDHATELIVDCFDGDNARGKIVARFSTKYALSERKFDSFRVSSSDAKYTIQMDRSCKSYARYCCGTGEIDYAEAIDSPNAWWWRTMVLTRFDCLKMAKIWRDNGFYMYKKKKIIPFFFSPKP